MAHRISVDPNNNLLTIEYDGLVSIAERSDSLSEMLPLLDIHRIRRVLADMTSAKVATDAFDESNAFAFRLACEASSRGCRLAYVARPGARVNHVVDTLAAARGCKFAKFHDRAAAMEWLCAIAPQAQAS